MRGAGAAYGQRGSIARTRSPGSPCLCSRRASSSDPLRAMQTVLSPKRLRGNRRPRLSHLEYPWRKFGHYPRRRSRRRNGLKQWPISKRMALTNGPFRERATNNGHEQWPIARCEMRLTRLCDVVRLREATLHQAKLFRTLHQTGEVLRQRNAKCTDRDRSPASPRRSVHRAIGTIAPHCHGRGPSSPPYEHGQARCGAPVEQLNAPRAQCLLRRSRSSLRQNGHRVKQCSRAVTSDSAARSAAGSRP